jgi:hypothetical protein
LAGAAAVVLTALAWLQPLPALGAEDARQFSADAFEAAGFTEGFVEPGARPDVYTDSDGERLDVWVTVTQLDGQPVELWIDPEESEAVQINDNTAEGPLLDDEQFRIVDDYDRHPDTDERHGRNWIVTGAAVAGVAVAVGLAWFTLRKTAPR